jgi:predicted CDP-diglyceride synthetase/phosphatidate cytidylyltransferase
MTHRVIEVKAQIHNINPNGKEPLSFKLHGCAGSPPLSVRKKGRVMETVLFFGSVVALQTVTDVPTGITSRLPYFDWHRWRFRLQAWSMLAGLYALAIMLNNAISVVLLSFVVYHLLKGFFSMVRVRIVDRMTLLLAFSLVPLQIYWLWAGLPHVVFYLSLFVPLGYMVLTARSKGWLESAGKLIWATAGSIALIGFLTMTMVLPSAIPPVTAGLLMFTYALIFRYVSAAVWHGR